MPHPKTVIYKGKKYHLLSSGRYYGRSNGKAKEKLLHRVIWTELHGPIPVGMCVHHINHDWTDNSIGNLALMSSSDHSRLHIKDSWKHPEKLRAWHGSAAGREWYREQGKKLWKYIRANKITRTCRCGKRFRCYKVKPKKYCSALCVGRYRILRMEARTCGICHQPFAVRTDRDTSTCSRHCSQVLRWKRIKEIVR